MLEKQSNSRLTSDKATERSKPLEKVSSATENHPLVEELYPTMIIEPLPPYGRNLKKN